MARAITITGGRNATEAVIPGDFCLSVGLPDRKAPSGWSWRPLTAIARLESGHTPSRKHPEYWGGDVPWIGIRDATSNHGRVICETSEYTNSLGIANLSARLLPADTVCLSRTASVGYVVVMGRPMATSQDFVNWVCSSELNPHFLKYVLLAETRALQMFAVGSVHPTIYYPEVKALHICTPNRAEQDRIVSVLKALDDKIELNRRMNETLEAMARAIFKDWFVDFGPTRAKMEGRVPYLASEMWTLFPDQFDPTGMPSGWRLDTLGEHVLNYDSKRVPVSSGERAKRRGAYPYHGATCVMDYIDDYLFDGTYILVGEDGSVVKDNGLAFTQYVWGKFWVNNHAHVLQGKGSVSSEHLLMYFQHEVVTPFVTGAVQLKLSQGRMNSMPFTYAGENVCRKFGDVVAPLFARVRANVDQSNTLAKARDLLLPKLMSGEIRVKEADKIVEAVA